MRSDIRVEGLAELRKELRRLADQDLKNELKDAHKAVSELIVKRALPKVPVLTGRLKASVRSLASQTAARGAVGGKRLPYAPPIHWGWPAHNIPRRPFLLDALNESQSEGVDVYEQRLDRLLDKVRSR